MFDKDLVTQMANVIGQELRVTFLQHNTSSIDCWGPVINLNRDPRWGRNGEGGLEDAYAMGELAEAWTKGFQDPRPSKKRKDRELLQAVITIKHMAVNSLENTEPYNRHNFDANATYGMDPFVLMDYYIKPYRSAIQNGGARGIMCSYNAVMGIPTCLDSMMRDFRKSWGFEGYVTSDSDSVNNAWHDHKYVKTAQEATALALVDGECDINSGDTYFANALNAVGNRTDNLTMSAIDRALFNSLKQRFDLGLFDPFDAYEWPTVDDYGSQSSWDMSLLASQEALVLLRNDNALLPLRKGQKVAVIGPHVNAQATMTQPYPAVPYCADGLSCIKSPSASIAAINGDDSTSSSLACDLFDPSEDGFAEAIELAKEAEVVVLMLGIEVCGFNSSHNLNPQASHKGGCYQEKSTSGYVFPDQYLELEAHDRTDMTLPKVQQRLASEVLKLGKPVLLVLINAGAVAIDSILSEESARNGAQKAPFAIIEAFYPGPRGGEALAQGIYGLHNRWGRMPYTIYPESFQEEASMLEHDLRVTPGRSYRYYRNPTFAFGHGLSLTNFEVKLARLPNPSALSCPTFDTAGNVKCTVTLHVRNTGSKTGDDIIMAYFTRIDSDHPARRHIDGQPLLSPIKGLFAFERVKDVSPQESKSIQFTFNAKDFATPSIATGDVESRAGKLQLSFEDGTSITETSIEITGPTVVLEQFPARNAARLA